MSVGLRLSQWRVKTPLVHVRQKQTALNDLLDGTFTRSKQINLYINYTEVSCCVH